MQQLIIIHWKFHQRSGPQCNAVRNSRHFVKKKKKKDFRFNYTIIVTRVIVIIEFYLDGAIRTHREFGCTEWVT